MIAETHAGWDQLIRTRYARDHQNLLTPLLEVSDDARETNESETDVLLHNDFKGEHFLVHTSNDDNDGALAGVIDWSDAVVGDVAIDVRGLVISVGQRMAKRIALRAGVSHSAVERGIVMARCDAIINLKDRINGDDHNNSECLCDGSFIEHLKTHRPRRCWYEASAVA